MPFLTAIMPLKDDAAEAEAAADAGSGGLVGGLVEAAKSAADSVGAALDNDASGAAAGGGGGGDGRQKFDEAISLEAFHAEYSAFCLRYGLRETDLRGALAAALFKYFKLTLCMRMDKETAVVKHLRWRAEVPAFQTVVL